MKIIKIISILSAITIAALVIPAIVSASAEPKQTATSDQRPAANIFERFRKTTSVKSKPAADEVSPLVKEAKLFKEYLVPPPPPPPLEVRIENPTTGIPNNQTPPRESPLSSVFVLKATCVNEANPDQSLALIDLPGEGLKWVRQGRRVGHLMVKEIKSNMVVCTSGNQQTVNIQVEPRPVQPSLVKADAAASISPEQTGFYTAPFAPPATQTLTRPGLNRTLTAESAAKAGPSASTPPTSPKRAVSDEEKKSVEKFLNELAATRNDTSSEEERTKKSDELLKLLFSKQAAASKAASSRGSGPAQSRESTGKQPDNADSKADSNDPNSTRRQPPRRASIPQK